MTNALVTNKVTPELLLAKVLADAGRAAEKVVFPQTSSDSLPSLTSELKNPGSKTVADLFSRSLVFVTHITENHSQHDHELMAAVTSRAEATSKINFTQPTQNPYEQIRRGIAAMMVVDEAIRGKLGMVLPDPLRNCGRNDRTHIGGSITDLSRMLQHRVPNAWLNEQVKSYKPEAPGAEVMANLVVAAGGTPVSEKPALASRLT